MTLLLRTLRRPATLYAAIVLWFGAVLFICFASPNFRGSLTDGKATPGGDYLQFYLAARMITEGFADQLYDFALQQSMQRDPEVVPYTWDPNSYLLFVYPPFVAAFFIPLSLLPFMSSALVWMGVMLLCGAASLLLLRAELKPLRPYLGALLFAALIYRPAVHAIYSCQNSTLSLLLFTATWLLLRRDREYSAGAVAALLSFKPQLLLMFGLIVIATRAWRVLAGLCSMGAALLVVSLLVSVSATTEYFLRVPQLSRWIEMPGMQLAGMSCWYGFFRLALRGFPLGAIQLLTVLASLVTAGLVLVRVRSCGVRDEVGWSMVILGTLLISPHLLAYDLTLLLLPCVLLACSGAKGAPTLAASLFIAAIVSPAIAQKLLFQPVVPVMFVALLLLCRAPEPAVV